MLKEQNYPGGFLKKWLLQFLFDKNDTKTLPTKTDHPPKQTESQFSIAMVPSVPLDTDFSFERQKWVVEK